MRLLPLALLLTASAAPAAALELSGEAGVVSDYRFRGVSLSSDRPAIQASLTVEHAGGLYAEAWASSLGNGDPLNAEVDLTGGLERKLTDAVTLNLSATYYLYPRDGSANYGEATALASVTRGRSTWGLGVSYAPVQRGNRYVFGSWDYAATDKLTVKAALGNERGTFDAVAHGAKWDWSIGGELAVAPVRLGASYVGSTADGGDRHALVGSLFISW